MIRLEPPSDKYRESFLAAYGETESKIRVQESSLLTEAGFSAYVQKLLSESSGENLKPGYVPATVFWMIDADGYAGRISLRHYLTDALREMGGHVGYDVRPSKRGKGYATEALRLVLVEARKMGIDDVLITCDADNLPSRRVIEKNGGVLEEVQAGEDDKPAICRYRMDLGCAV